MMLNLTKKEQEQEQGVMKYMSFLCSPVCVVDQSMIRMELAGSERRPQVGLQSEIQLPWWGKYETGNIQETMEVCL